MDSSVILLVGLFTVLLHKDLASAVVTPVKNVNDYPFIAFIGAKITHNTESGAQGDVIREVIGIGAVLGDKHILTTEEYLKWNGQPNMEYFILLGTNDFDVGGEVVSIKEVKKVPQAAGQNGAHTLVLIICNRVIVRIPGVMKMLLDSVFVPSSFNIEMIGIYQRTAIQLGATKERVRANAECKDLLNTNPKDKRYNNLGSHMCVVSTNMLRVDCKSHVGTLLFYRVSSINFLVGIKSALHQSCSKPPYVIEFQRTSHVVDWFKKNLV